MGYGMTIERALEPREDRYIPMMTEEEEDRLCREFCKDRLNDFVEFIDGYDSTIFWDFIESNRWLWEKFKEENRVYE